MSAVPLPGHSSLPLADADLHLVDQDGGTSAQAKNKIGAGRHDPKPDQTEGKGVDAQVNEGGSQRNPGYHGDAPTAPRATATPPSATPQPTAPARTDQPKKA